MEEEVDSYIRVLRANRALRCEVVIVTSHRKNNLPISTVPSIPYTDMYTVSD